MRFKALLVVVLSLLLSGLGYIGLAHAQSIKSGQDITVPQNQTVNSTLFAAGRTIDIAGTVNGDVFCAGQTVTVTGTIHGDVICAGQDVRVAAKVDGNVRLAGQTVNLGGTVGLNATIAGQTITTDGNSAVGGDVMVGATTANLNGAIGRDLGVTANGVTIANKVGRNVQASVTSLTLNNGAIVNGSMTYHSANRASIQDGAQVKGSITQLPPIAHKGSSYRVFAGGWLIVLYLFISILVTAVVLALLFPMYFHDSTELARKHALRTTLVGLATVVLGPIVLLALSISLIGLPLALLFFIGWILVLMLSGAAFSYWLGRYLLPRSQHASLIMLAGAALLLVLYIIPIIGFLAGLAATIFGSGIIVDKIFYHLPKPAHPIKR